MNRWMYLSKNDFCITREKDTPVSIRIQLSHATVKALHSRLQYAYQRDDIKRGECIYHTRSSPGVMTRRSCRYAARRACSTS